MLNHALHHVSVEVDDLALTARFYSDTLGLAVYADRPADLPIGVWLKAGDRRINLEPRGQGHPHFALVVQDLEREVGRLRNAGVEVAQMTDPFMNVMVQDPSGNWVELRQPPDVWKQRFEPG